MAIDILNLQPSVIDKKLSGKSILLAGEPKIGKSEFCSQSPDTLILDFENGYNTKFGLKLINIEKWSDVKMIVQQLRKPDARKMYKNVVIDTLNEAWDLCTTFICAQNNVQRIKDIPYGQGYSMRDTEFGNTLTEIIRLGYGLIVTCHTKEKIIGSENDVDIVSLAPDLDKRCTPIINGLVDIMGMIVKTWNEDTKEWDRWLLTKSTPTVAAGTRIAYLPAKIPFGYKYLQEAIANALGEAEKHGAIVVENAQKEISAPLDYKALMNEARELWTKLTSSEDEEKNEEMAKRIAKRVEMIFGTPTRISDIEENQVDLLQLVIADMKELEE